MTYIIVVTLLACGTSERGLIRTHPLVNLKVHSYDHKIKSGTGSRNCGVLPYPERQFIRGSAYATSDVSRRWRNSSGLHLDSVEGDVTLHSAASLAMEDTRIVSCRFL